MSKKSVEIVENNFKMEIGIEKHLIVYNKVIKAKNEFHKIKYLNKSDVKAIITDLDRTITDRPGKPEFDPADFDKELLNDLKNLGIDLILATGRNIYYAKKLCHKFNIWRCVVAENGAVIYFPPTKKTITLNTLYMRKAKKIIKNFNLPNTVIGRVITSNKIEDEKIIRKELGKIADKVCFVKNVEDIMVAPINVNKGLGLRLAMQYLNIDMEKTIVIGDGENDVDMFLNPGFKVALSNADKKLKRLADQVTKDPSTTGVREIIQQLNETK